MQFPISSSRKRVSQAFSLVEMLVVIGIIGILAGLILGGAQVIGPKKKRSQAKAQLQQLVTLIEAYKSKFQSYPPDNFVAGASPASIPQVNTLFYELGGTSYNPTTSRFFSPISETELTSGEISSAFRIGGFQNSTDGGNQAENYLKDMNPGKIFGRATVNGVTVDVLKVNIEGPAGATLNGPDGAVNVWHYRATNPVYNKSGFDLWTEIKVGDSTEVIGNWGK